MGAYYISGAASQGRLSNYVNKKNPSPCLSCEKRAPCCHDTCESYISWKDFIKAKKNDMHLRYCYKNVGAPEAKIRAARYNERRMK